MCVCVGVCVCVCGGGGEVSVCVCVWGGEVSVWGGEGRYIVCGLCLCVPYSLLSILHLFIFILLFLIRVSIHIVSLLPFLPLLSLSSPSSPSFPLTTPKVNFNEPLSTSCYAANRVNKPFNPMLGETYECDRRAELGWRCFMEQPRVTLPIKERRREGRGKGGKKRGRRKKGGRR